MGIIQLVYNLAILATVSVFSGFIDARWNRSKTSGSILQGIAFGVIAIIAMLNPFVLSKGLIFDGRSIVLSLCALFFGPVAGIIAWAMAVITRIIIGGNGVYMGVAVITSSVFVGLVYNRLRKVRLLQVKISTLYFLGLIVHLLMLLWMSFLPGSLVLSTYAVIAFPVVVIFPVATVLIGKILTDQENSAVFLSDLKESEEKYRTLYDTMAQGVVHVDASGNILNANPAAVKILGKRITEFIEPGRVALNGGAIHEDGSPITAESHPYRQALITGKEVHNVTMGVYNLEEDGYKWLKVTAIPQFRGNQARPYQVHITLEDITINKVAKERLERSESQYRLLADHMTDMIWLTDLKLNVTYISPSIERFRGFTLQELMELPIQQQVCKNSLTRLMSEYREHMQKLAEDEHYNFVLSLDLEFYKKDGSTFWSENTFSLIRDAEGKPISILGEGRDITRRMRSERMIKQLSRAVDQSPATIIITDLEGRIEYANKKAVEVSGYSLEELIGQNPKILASGELPKDEYKKMWDTINAGNEWRGEFHNKKKNGELYWENALISPIKNEAGEFSHFLAVKEDITERKEFINTLTIEKDRAERAAKLKDAFIANISHEIRTPLNGILGMTELIKLEFAHLANDEHEHFFRAIDKSSRRLMHAVDTILYFSQLQVGDYPVKPVPVHLQRLIEEIILPYHKEAEERNICLEMQSKLTDDLVSIDVASVSRAVINIIDNALKYTDQGSITVNLYEDEAGQICVDFTDTGIGISSEYLQRLFEPYSQEEVGYSRGYEGLGLGLPIVKKILDLNKISIEVSSAKGVGSTFRLQFIPDRVNVVNDVIQQANIKTLVKAEHRPAVLIVEDDAINKMFMQKTLAKDFQVFGAADAETALSTFNSEPIDIILMDISLKRGSSGLDLTRTIRGGNTNPQVIIIAVTAHAFDEDKRRCYEAGCNDFLSKPFTHEQLLNTVARFV